jgi:MSHA biogenesis protein MshO
MQKNCGFTLVEMIITIVLIGILAAVGSNMLSDSFKTTGIVNSSYATEGKARYALERLAREIREVKYCSGTGCLNGVTGYCVSTMTASKLVFNKRTVPTSTNKADCTTDATQVTLDFSTSPNLGLAYGTVNGGNPLVNLSDQVAAGGFAYYQCNGTTAATGTTDVCFVQISLTLNDSTSGQSTALRMRVALRNS